VNGPLPPTDPRPLRGAPVAVIDFESTGVDPENDRAVSVAVVYIPALGESEPLPLLYTLLNPGRPIPAEASAIHGIFDKDVSEAPTFAEVADIIAEAVDGALLCAYNLTYDWTMLRAEMKRAGHPMPLPFGSVDPLVLARHTFRYVGPRYKKLGDMASHYKIAIEAHNALSDAEATAIMLPKLLHDAGHGVPMDPRPGRPCPKEALMSVDRFWRWLLPVAVEGEERFLENIKRWKDPGPNRWLQLSREAM
jgi:DNA polymerase III epsilon subunit-like protein